ncbi:MAG: LysM peptidoglycan-binding domain-containing protein [Bacteroidia bacterium]|nr:LysM peptidoglycan-binding domain-containing protein [Bacteroidia bacterium]
MYKTVLLRVTSHLSLILLCLLAMPVSAQISDFEYLGEVEDYRLSHKVMPGESLYAIARQHGISVDDLRELNDLKDDTIFPGQRLLVKNSAPETTGANLRTAAATTQQNVPVSPYTEVERRQYYQVQDGDKIEDVAAMFRVHPDRLREWNTTADIYPGQALIVDKWYETVATDALRGSIASANQRVSTRGMEETTQAAPSIGMEPVGHISSLSMGPFGQTETQNNSRYGQDSPTYYPATSQTPVTEEGGWLMERATYDTYLLPPSPGANRTRGIDETNSYQRNAQPQPQAMFDEVEVSGPYEVREDRYRSTTSAYYAYHNELPVGSKIQVYIPNNAGFIEVEVIGQLAPGTRSIIALSPAVARIIEGAGMRDQRVTVRY